MRVHVQYFALLRDERGLGEEVVEAAPGLTTLGLYHELRARHALSLPPERLLVAVGDEFATWERELTAGDRVVFIPPVAGG